MEDCGHRTPVGFRDEWASGVVSVDETDGECEERLELLLGPPARVDGVSSCASAMWSGESVWRRCAGGVWWVVVEFGEAVVATGVVVHLASDGDAFHLPHRSVTASLVDESGGEHRLETEQSVSCSEQPLLFSYRQNLSEPFFQSRKARIEVSSPDIVLSAIRLRSWRHLNPTQVIACGSQN